MVFLNNISWGTAKKKKSLELSGQKVSKENKTSTTRAVQNIMYNSIQEAIFSHTIPKMDFHYSHFFSREKKH